MFAIEDERHAEMHGTYATEADAVAELKRRSRVPWNEEPNRAPCTNWTDCGRSHELVEYGDNNLSTLAGAFSYQGIGCFRRRSSLASTGGITRVARSRIR